MKMDRVFGMSKTKGWCHGGLIWIGLFGERKPVFWEDRSYEVGRKRHRRRSSGASWDMLRWENARDARNRLGIFRADGREGRCARNIVTDMAGPVLFPNLEGSTFR